jgi:hypothetical protein
MEGGVEHILASLTPEKLEQVIRELARKQAVDDRGGVMIPRIVEALVGDQGLGVGQESWQNYLKFKEAIRSTVSQISGMRYVDVDE